jgi:hypothetical protein
MIILEDMIDNFVIIIPGRKASLFSSFANSIKIAVNGEFLLKISFFENGGCSFNLLKGEAHVVDIIIVISNEI